MEHHQIQVFKEFMESQRYAARTICLYTTYLKRLPDFTVGIDEGTLFKHIKISLSELRCSCSKSELINLKAAANLFFKMTTGTKVKDYEKALRPPGRFEWQLKEFYNYSVNVKKIRLATAESECTHVRQFLETVFYSVKSVIFGEITATDIKEYICVKFPGLADSSKGRYVTSIRNFFRFLAYEEIHVHPSIFKLPMSPAIWNSSSYPTILSEDEVERMLTFYCEKTGNQKRNHTIILIFLDLGLRCSEVPSIMLSDIHWNKGEILIRNTKTNSERTLPVSVRLGKALEEYVLHYRPKSSDGHLFLRTGRCEGLVMDKEGIRRVVRFAFEKQNIKGWWKGTHTLRRTAASKVFNAGNSLKLTADFLGHKSIEATTAYIKIDIDSLRSLAGKWPSGGAL